MPPKRKQTRRAITISERAYQAIKQIAASRGVAGIPLSRVLEDLIKQAFDEHGPIGPLPLPDRDTP